MCVHTSAILRFPIFAALDFSIYSWNIIYCSFDVENRWRKKWIQADKNVTFGIFFSVLNEVLLIVSTLAIQKIVLSTILDFPQCHLWNYCWLKSDFDDDYFDEWFRLTKISRKVFPEVPKVSIHAMERSFSSRKFHKLLYWLSQGNKFIPPSSSEVFISRNFSDKLLFFPNDFSFHLVLYHRSFESIHSKSTNL